MPLALLLVVLAAPLLELALLIKVGQSIGVWPTVGIVVATAIGGAMLIRGLGLRVVTRAMADVAERRSPLMPVLDHGLMFLAGVLLILPGLTGDALGLLLLVPPVRRLLEGVIRSRASRAGWVVVETFSTGREPRAGDGNGRFGGRSGRSDNGAPVIEGEFERLDETEADRPGRPKPPQMR